MIVLLNQATANAIHLRIIAKNMHWNVRGTTFLQLHELFDKVYNAAGDWSDSLAERAAQLGGHVDARLDQIKRSSVIPEPSETTFKAKECTEAMADALGEFARNVRSAIDAADKAGDAGTADLFTEVSRGADEMLWFVEAHLTD